MKTAPPRADDPDHPCLLLWLPMLKQAAPIVWLILLLFLLLPTWLLFTWKWLLPRRVSNPQGYRSTKELEIAGGVVLLATTWVVTVLHILIPILQHVHANAHDVFTPILLANLVLAGLSALPASRLRNSIVSFELAHLRIWAERNFYGAETTIPALIQISRVRTRLFTIWTLALVVWLINLSLKSAVLRNERPGHSVALYFLVLDLWISNVGVLGWLMEAVIELLSFKESMRFVESLADLPKRERNVAWRGVLEHWQVTCTSKVLGSLVASRNLLSEEVERDREPLLAGERGRGVDEESLGARV